LKILIITTRIPYPPNRGDKLRIFNIIKTLLKDHEIKVVSFFHEKTEFEYAEQLKKFGIDFEKVELSRFKSTLNLFRTIFSIKPFQVSYYQYKSMHKKISELITNKKYDVVYFHSLIMAQYHSSISYTDVIKVLDQTDATSLYLSRYLKFLVNPLKRIYFEFDLRKTKKYEHILKNFDTVFVCSETDKQYLHNKINNANIQLFMNGFDSQTFKYEKRKPEKDRIIFTGNMPYFPNQDAMVYFIKEIFPLILDKRPTVMLYIVGNNPTTEIKKLQSQNVIITGYVNDIREEYLKSAVNIAPIRFGTGTPNKVIEALALGIPTVATGLSINGFPEELQKYFFVADTPKSFADAVLDLLNNEHSKDIIMDEAVETINRVLSIDNVVKNAFNYLYERLLIQRQTK